MVEHAAVNRGVVGSSPTSGANFSPLFFWGVCSLTVGPFWTIFIFLVFGDFRVGFHTGLVLFSIDK